MTNRKILIVMPVAEQRGGAEQCFLDLSRYDSTAGQDWGVIFLENGTLAEVMKEKGWNVKVIPSGQLRNPVRWVRTILSISRFIRHHRYHVVVAWMQKGHLYAGPAALLARVPSLWFNHAMASTRSWMDNLATRIPAEGILFCSDVGQEAQRKLRPLRTMRTVHPGVPLERFDPHALPTPREARERLGLPLDGPIVGMVGRLQRWKGFHTLVQAMPELLKSHPNAHCVLVGGEHRLEPEYPKFLDNLIRELGLEGKVTLAGHQTNIPEWMQSMDVVVHASENEPFGIVVIEAMALGKPVVAGAEGGPREIIDPEVNGLLAPYDDAPELARCVLRYLDNPEFAQQMAQAARVRAEHFASTRYAEEFLTAVASVSKLNGIAPSNSSALLDSKTPG